MLCAWILHAQIVPRLARVHTSSGGRRLRKRAAGVENSEPPGLSRGSAFEAPPRIGEDEPRRSLWLGLRMNDNASEEPLAACRSVNEQCSLAVDSAAQPAD